MKQRSPTLIHLLYAEVPPKFGVQSVVSTFHVLFPINILSFLKIFEVESWNTLLAILIWWKVKQQNSKLMFISISKILSSLLSSEGELLLDETWPHVLCDGQVWLPGAKTTLTTKQQHAQVQKQQKQQNNNKRKYKNNKNNNNKKAQPHVPPEKRKKTITIKTTTMIIRTTTVIRKKLQWKN